MFARQIFAGRQRLVVTAIRYPEVPMRIALVTDRVGPLIESGTTDVVAAPLAGALAGRGHRVTLYAHRVGLPAPAGVEVVRLGGGPAAPADRLPTRRGETDRDPL